MMPLSSRRRTRSCTAGGDRPTRRPSSAYVARARARSASMSARSMASNDGGVLRTDMGGITPPAIGISSNLRYHAYVAQPGTPDGLLLFDSTAGHGVRQGREERDMRTPEQELAAERVRELREAGRATRDGRTLATRLRARSGRAARH